MLLRAMCREQQAGAGGGEPRNKRLEKERVAAASVSLPPGRVY